MKPDTVEPAIPRLGIFHLMTLTAGVAIFLGLLELTKTLQPTTNEKGYQTFSLIMNLLFALPIGMSLAGLFWLAQIKRRTGKYCWRSGHWMLACFGINFLMVWIFNLGLMTTVAFSDQPGSESYGELMFVGLVISMSLTIPVTIAAAIAVGGKSWKWFFVLLAVAQATQVIQYAIYSLGMGFSSFGFIRVSEWAKVAVSAGLVVAFVVALIRDRIRKEQNDWVHWCGVLVFLLYWIVAPIAQILAFRFLLPSALWSVF